MEWLPFLSCAELTERLMHSRTMWVSRAAPLMVCRDWPQSRFPDSDTGDLQSAQALPGYLLICGSPFSWSHPHSLLRERGYLLLNTLLAGCCLSVLTRCISSDQGGGLFAWQSLWSFSLSLTPPTVVTEHLALFLRTGSVVLGPLSITASGPNHLRNGPGIWF